MSTNTYSMVQDAAFLIDEEVAAYIALARDKKQNCVPVTIASLSQKDFGEMARAMTLPEEDYKDVETAQYLSSVCFVSGFDGELTTLFPEKAKDPINEKCEDDFIHYIPAQRTADLFSVAYTSPDELLIEFKELFASNRVELPEDFDWWKHIIKIEGTIYC